MITAFGKSELKFLVSLTHCSVLDGFRNRIERDFTIELKLFEGLYMSIFYKTPNLF